MCRALDARPLTTRAEKRNGGSGGRKAKSDMARSFHGSRGEREKKARQGDTRKEKDWNGKLTARNAAKSIERVGCKRERFEMSKKKEKEKYN